MTELVQTYLMTADLERSRRFYESGLGLAVRREGDTSVSYETGGCELKLQGDFDADTLGGFGLEPPGEHRGDGVITVVETTDGLDDVHERIADLEAEFGEVLAEPRNVPWGGRMFLARDSNGYVFEIRPADESS